MKYGIELLGFLRIAALIIKLLTAALAEENLQEKLDEET